MNEDAQNKFNNNKEKYGNKETTFRLPNDYVDVQNELTDYFINIKRSKTTKIEYNKSYMDIDDLFLEPLD